MNETVTVIEKVYQLGPGVIAALILVMGARRSWCWYYHLTDCEARGQAAVAAAEKREQLWREMYNEQLKANQSLIELYKKALVDAYTNHARRNSGGTD